ncbi:hypothetical protein E4U16_007962 [Claviceps sp. LM84 group G4]|nr:hypothetical protein E4U16_007962 [Claviceps sp. LM84 group G4]
MARAAVPPEQVFVWRVMPPAVTASTTTTITAPSRPSLPNHAQQQQLALGLDGSTSISHQRQLLCFVTSVIANYCDRSPQQRQLPAFAGPNSHQQAPLNSPQSHQPHAPWSIDHGAHEQYHGVQVSAPDWRSIQSHAQPLAPAANSSGPQLRAPSTSIDADDSFRFSIPARQYSWAGCSMLYDSTDNQ